MQSLKGFFVELLKEKDSEKFFKDIEQLFELLFFNLAGNEQYLTGHQSLLDIVKVNIQ